MLKDFFLRCGLFFLFLSVCTHTIFAHEGHDHSHDTVITIGKKTFVYLQSVLSIYQEVYHHLVKKDMHGIADLAHKLSDAALQAMQTEPEGAGRDMMEHIQEGAEGLKKARDIQEARGALMAITDSLIPFFKAWPNQLKRNKLKLFYCMKDGHHWLQPLNCSVACPYNSDISFDCIDIDKVK